MLVDLFRKTTLQSLAEFVRECVLVQERHSCDRDIRMKFVKLGSSGGRFCPTLSEHHRLRNRIKIPETGGYVFC